MVASTAFNAPIFGLSKSGRGANTYKMMNDVMSWTASTA